MKTLIVKYMARNERSNTKKLLYAFREEWFDSVIRKGITFGERKDGQMNISNDWTPNDFFNFAGRNKP
jgi:hypothetical protein